MFLQLPRCIMFPEGRTARPAQHHRKKGREREEGAESDDREQGRTTRCLTTAARSPLASCICCASDQTEIRTGDLRLRRPMPDSKSHNGCMTHLTPSICIACAAIPCLAFNCLDISLPSIRIVCAASSCLAVLF